MTRAYVFLDGDGNQCFASTESALLPKGAKAMPRMPGPFERWDFDAGAFVYDAIGHANDIAGPAHIATMHARKAVEAHLIAAGVDAPGLLLVREAALRGVTAAELAAAVLEKIAPAEALELERQAASLPTNQEV